MRELVSTKNKKVQSNTPNTNSDKILLENNIFFYRIRFCRESEIITLKVLNVRCSFNHVFC